MEPERGYNMKGQRRCRAATRPPVHPSTRPPAMRLIAHLERLYDYHYWANRKLLGAVSSLTPEQFTQDIAGSYGSIRNTLVHVLSAEWGWLDRCGGPPRGERLNAEDYPTLDSVVEIWSRVERDMRAFLTGLTEDDLAREIEFAFGPDRSLVATQNPSPKPILGHSIPAMLRPPLRARPAISPRRPPSRRRCRS